jgi:cation:H+ antiporter
MLIVYAVGTFVIFRLGESQRMSFSAQDLANDAPSPSIASSVAMFVLAATLILIAAPRLAASAGEFSARSGFSATLIGTLLLGITTALPELATAVAAARIGASDFAVAALFGPAPAIRRSCLRSALCTVAISYSQESTEFRPYRGLVPH